MNTACKIALFFCQFLYHLIGFALVALLILSILALVNESGHSFQFHLKVWWYSITDTLDMLLRR